MVSRSFRSTIVNVSNSRSEQIKSAPEEHTAFALTRSAVNDGGKFTKQFFKGTRATSAVEEGFLGAIFQALWHKQGMNYRMRDLQNKRRKKKLRSQHLPRTSAG